MIGTSSECGWAIFDGSNDFVSTTTQFTNPQVFTIEVWIRTSDGNSGKIIGFETHQTGTSSPQYDRMLYVNTSGKAVFGVYNNQIFIATSSTTINNGDWHHIVGAYNINTNIGTLWVNGIVESSFNTSNIQNYSGYWRLGSHRLLGWTNASDGYLSGDISLARVYVGKSLNTSEVLINYTNSSSCFHSVTPTATPTVTPTETPSP